MLYMFCLKLAIIVQNDCTVRRLFWQQMEQTTKNILDHLYFHCPTTEQKNALALEQFVKEENKDDSFVLCGAAGTGKTSITSALIGYLGQTETQYRISSPT